MSERERERAGGREGGRERGRGRDKETQRLTKQNGGRGDRVCARARRRRGVGGAAGFGGSGGVWGQDRGVALRCREVPI